MVNQAVYEKLVEVARTKGTIGYRALAQVADVSLDADDDIKNLGLILDEIADQETAAKRPLLPVIVLKDNASSANGAEIACNRSGRWV